MLTLPEPCPAAAPRMDTPPITWSCRDRLEPASASVDGLRLLDDSPRHDCLRVLQQPAQAGRLLQRLAVQGLAEALPAEALLEFLGLVSQAGLRVRLTLHDGPAPLAWEGPLKALSSGHGQAQARGPGLHLGWREDLPGEPAWLLRSPSSRGLAHSLLLLSPDGRLRLALSAAEGEARPEPCAWRSAVEWVRGGRAGRAC